MQNDSSTVAVVILTYNESLHIERCIRSVKRFASEVYVVDSFSTDDTVSTAESLGAVVFQRSWKNYADQFQWALDNIGFSSEWVVRLDADEYFDDRDLGVDVVKYLNGLPTHVVGCICSLRNVYFGKKMFFGGYDPLKLLRVWRRQAGRIESRWMDEHIVLDDGVTSIFPVVIVHDNLNNNRWWVDKHNRYADREMVDILSRKYGFFEHDIQVSRTDNLPVKLKRFLKERLYNRLPLFVRPLMYFCLRYVFMLGFLEGKRGFSYHFFHAFWYRALVDLRVYEAERVLFGAKDNKERLRRLEALTGLELNG